MTEFVMHHWGNDATSECGLDVALAYRTNDIGFSSGWEEVNCKQCIKVREKEELERSRMSARNRLTSTASKQEWAIRTENEVGLYVYATMYQPGWGTRFQDPPVPYTRETAENALKNSSQFLRTKNPTVVSRESVTVTTEWREES